MVYIATVLKKKIHHFHLAPLADFAANHPSSEKAKVRVSWILSKLAISDRNLPVCMCVCACVFIRNKQCLNARCMIQEVFEFVFGGVPGF